MRDRGCSPLLEREEKGDGGKGLQNGSKLLRTSAETPRKARGAMCKGRNGSPSDPAATAAQLEQENAFTLAEFSPLVFLFLCARRG